AVWALGQLGPPARPAAAAVRGLLEDADPTVRTLAACALWQIEQDAGPVVAVLASTLPRCQPEQAYALSSALWEMGDPAAPAVLEALGQAQGPARDGLVGVLAVLARKSASVEQTLRDAQGAADAGRAAAAREVLEYRDTLDRGQRAEQLRTLTLPPLL